MLDILINSPIAFLFLALSLIVAISIHEFAHAYTADKLGDPTAKNLGRVTLDPRSHLDPIGTLMLVLFGFGWGRPVPFNPNMLKNPKRDAAIISFAGPASNIILALVFSLFVHVFGVTGVLFSILQLFVQYNLVLAIFNMIPVHPLDGFKVVYGLLPEELSYQWIQLAPYGMWILMFMIFAGVTRQIIFPLLTFGMGVLGF